MGKRGLKIPAGPDKMAVIGEFEFLILTMGTARAGRQT
jgi:hypothetical protein